jgi:hypothetical protein
MKRRRSNDLPRENSQESSMLTKTPSVAQLMTPVAAANFSKLKGRDKDNSPGKGS